MNPERSAGTSLDKSATRCPSRTALMYQNRIVRPSRFHTLTMLLIKNALLLTSLSVVQFLYQSATRLRSLLPLLFPARSATISPDRSARRSPESSARMYLDKNAIVFPGKSASRYPSLILNTEQRLSARL